MERQIIGETDDNWVIATDLYTERYRYCIGLTIALRWMGANTWRNPEGVMETGPYWKVKGKVLYLC